MSRPHRTAATTRRRTRQLTGTILISLGTAVFAGTVQIVVDALVKDTTFRWPYIAGLTILGLALSSTGGWLLTSLRNTAGLSIAATDRRGDTDRYLDEAEAFLRFGRAQFTTQTSLHIPVESAADLKHLRSRVTTGLRTLTQVEQQTNRIGLHFQGRQHVGFHLGGWLNVAARRIDLYAAASSDASDTHFLAARLGPAIATAPHPMTMTLCFLTDDAFTAAEAVTLAELPGLLRDTQGAVGLAVDVMSPTGDISFRAPVLQSAQVEGAVAVISLALPGRPDSQQVPGRGLGSTTAEWEGTVATVVAAAQAIPARPGLLYLKTPTALAVALGRYLYRRNWIPMRHQPQAQNPYKQFTDPSQM